MQGAPQLAESAAESRPLFSPGRQRRPSKFQAPEPLSSKKTGYEGEVSLLAAAAAASASATAAAQQGPASGSSTRRDVSSRSCLVILVEVTYPPRTGSAPHLHANGVAAFVVSSFVASKAGDAPEQTFHAGDAGWEPPGSIHRVSRNASTAEPATLLAIYVAPKGATAADLMKPL
jgi:quercetin dioxygenase-like cupin family protein